MAFLSSFDQAMAFQKPRSVAKKIASESRTHGEGAVVKRSIGRLECKSLDPFLLLDEFSVSPPAGFPDHGHRGFETITYILKGGLSHQDFSGNEGTIYGGDVQWMTAGRGIVHSEMPVGATTGLQLWVNLPCEDKLMEPRYAEVINDEMPVAREQGVEVKVVAGESMGLQYPIFTRTPIMYLVLTMRPSSQYHQQVPESWNAFAYVIDGEGVFGNDKLPATAHHLLVFDRDGDGLSVWNESSEPLTLILVGGKPLGEPVVHQGPFVMTTQAEVDQTVEDYRCGQNGFERARHWKSHWPQ